MTSTMRHLAWGALAALLVLAPASRSRAADGSTAVSAAKPPNVLLVVLDTVRRDALSVYGSARPTSPVLERFARSAVVHDSAHAVAPWTLPNHASLFTGLLPHAHGAHHGAEVLADSAVTLAELLRDRGYRTAAFVNNATVNRDRGFAQGFEDFLPVWREEVQRPLRANLPPQVGDEGARATGVLLGSWLEAGRDRDAPWFVFVNYREPHTPYWPAPEDRTALGLPEVPTDPLDSHVVRYDYTAFLSGAYRMSAADFARARGLYDGEVRGLDRQVGAMLDAFARAGQLENTLVILTSDHGEHFGEHGFVGHQFSLHEELLRVPLLVRYPDGHGAGTRSKTPVQLVDLFDTVLDVTGTPAPPGVRSDGMSLRGEEVRTRVFAEAYRPVRKLAEFARRFPDFDASPYAVRMRSVREGDHKLIQWEDGRAALFDLSADPGEERNLAAEDPERRAALAAVLERELGPLRRGAGGDGTAPAIVDPQLRRQLEALGYLDPGAEAPTP